MALETPWFQISNLQNDDRIILCYFKPLGLRYFVIADLGNEYTISISLSYSRFLSSHMYCYKSSLVSPIKTWGKIKYGCLIFEVLSQGRKSDDIANKRKRWEVMQGDMLLCWPLNYDESQSRHSWTTWDISRDDIQRKCAKVQFIGKRDNLFIWLLPISCLPMIKVTSQRVNSNILEYHYLACVTHILWNGFCTYPELERKDRNSEHKATLLVFQQ